jgi:hypothetical protein
MSSGSISTTTNTTTMPANDDDECAYLYELLPILSVHLFARNYVKGDIDAAPQRNEEARAP